jgi:hypothetical protein
MSDKIQRFRLSLALVAAAISVAAVAANLIHSGKMLWGAATVCVLALGVWVRERNVNGPS